MSIRNFKCPVPGCEKDAEFIRAIAEEGSVPKADMDKARKRIPASKSVARNFLVRCPVHGERNLQEFGHHFSRVPKSH
jgi:hypothetical protein